MRNAARGCVLRARRMSDHATFAGLIGRFGSAAAALAEVPRLARRGGADNFAIPRDADIDREIERLTKFGGG